METIWQDVRYAVRLLVRQPGFSVVAVLTLALGVGASSAIFSVIDAAMLRPLPYANPEQLVRVYPEIQLPDGRTSNPTASFDDMRLWQGNRDVFSHVAAFGRAFYGTIAEGEQPERLETMGMTEDYLALHGVVPLFGRDFNLDDMRVGAPDVVILGHNYWQRRFGGRADVVGESLRYDNTVATIVGVLPPGFYRDTPVFRPLRIPLDEAPRRGTGRVSVIGRLRQGVTIDRAAERLTATMPAETSRDGSTRPVHVRLMSMLEAATGQYRTTVYVLAGAVSLILLIACVNVAGLLLARGSVRQAELAVRASLGAGRRRIVRQLLTESVILAAAGGVVGVAVAWLSLDALVANIPVSLPANSPVTVNVTVLAATVVLLVPTTLLFGLAPAVRLSGQCLLPALSRAGRQQGTSLSQRGGQALIAAEVALAVVLVAGAGLMIRSFSRLSAVDLGFDPSGLATMEVLSLEPTPGARRAYYQALLRTLRAMPGISAAGGIDNFHLGTTTTFSSVSVEGESTGVNPFDVLPGYFEALDLPLREGRLPTEADYSAGVPFVVLSESAARAVFPDGRAAGRQLRRAGSEETYVVTGVVADVRHGGPLGDVDRTANQVYFPLTPDESDFRRPQALTFVLRRSGRVPDFADRLRQAAVGIGPRVLVERIRTGDEWLADRVTTPRSRTVLLGLLGGLGLVLAVVGVFGMTAYAVSRRTQEIGVRLVFGARPGAVVGRVLRDSAVPIAIGTAIGLGGAALATRVIASFLYETDPIDPLTFAVVAVVLVLSGCLAAWLPARRAARVDPVTALRAE